MKKLAKILLVFLGLVIIGIAGYCFYYGFNINKEFQPKTVYDKVIDNIGDNIFDYFEIDNKYFFGDNFKILGEIDYNLDGSYYLQNSSSNPDYIKTYNKISNLSNATTKYKYIQNNEEDKLYREINQKINEEEVLFKKIFVENATEYVYINGIGDKYINNGTNIYFENIDGGHTTKDNIDYLQNSFLTAVKNSLLEEYFEKEIKTITIDGEEKEVYQMSIRIDEERLKKILNTIIKELKKDERANNIICSVYKDFESFKIKTDDRFLDKDEVYTINIYADKIWVSPIKYEVIHLKNNDRDTYNYIGDKKGRLTYIHNDSVKYNVDVQINHKTYLFEFSNVSGKSLGKIKLDKYENMYSLDVDLSLDKKNYMIIYSFKIKDFEKNKKYTINDLVQIKYSEDNIIKFTGEIKNTVEVSAESEIKEEVGDVVIRSSLTEEEENNYKTVKERLKERFER